MVQLRFPQQLNLTGALAFAADVDGAPEAESYELDFARLGRSEPFGMLYSAMAVQRLRRARPRAVISAVNLDHCGYQSHMGFFQSCGLNVGNAPGEASGNQNYIPITELPVAEVRRVAAEQFVEQGDVVQQRAIDMARVLARRDDGDLVAALEYCLREIIRNVVEHSQSETIHYCAQYWPAYGRVQLAVLDDGVGIATSLARNPDLAINGDREALHLALMPGVSGAFHAGVRRRQNDPWQNAGFGLYMIWRLASTAGSFVLLSGNAGLLTTAGRKLDKPCNFSGTAIRVSLNIGSLNEVANRLRRFSVEGINIAQGVRRDGVVNADAASHVVTTLS